jgi:hypothetical protein
VGGIHAMETPTDGETCEENQKGNPWITFIVITLCPTLKRIAILRTEELEG